MDGKQNRKLNREQRIIRARKKKIHDLLSIAVGIVFIVFAAVLISVLNKDPAPADVSGAVSVAVNESSAPLTFEEKLSLITVKSFSCLLGEDKIEVDSFVVNAEKYGCIAQFTTPPDSSTPGDHAVEIRITDTTGENRVFRTNLKVLNIRKYVSAAVGSEPLVYSDFVLDNSVLVTMDKEPSDFDYTTPGKHIINIQIGSLQYQCVLNIVASGVSVSVPAVSES